MWFKRFRGGDLSLQNKDRGKPPSLLNEAHLRSAVEENTRTTVRELVEDLIVSKSTISTHLTAIGKVKKVDSWVSYDLSEKQQKTRMQICSSFDICP